MPTGPSSAAFHHGSERDRGRRRSHLLGESVTDRIGRANLDGSDVQTDFIHASNSGGVAVDADHIYWANGTESNSIGRANLDGSAVDPTFIPLPTYPLSIAVDADHLYWTLDECVGNCEFFRGRIVRAKLDGTDVENRFISTGTKTPFGLAVDALGPPGRASAKRASDSKATGSGSPSRWQRARTSITGPRERSRSIERTG